MGRVPATACRTPKKTLPSALQIWKLWGYSGKESLSPTEVNVRWHGRVELYRFPIDKGKDVARMVARPTSWLPVSGSPWVGDFPRVEKRDHLVLRHCLASGIR